jgi:nucleotide-binding universal stress UspA family protein
MKKVLIALDYNPTAQKVAESGHSIAKAIGAEVYLMHVIADPGYYAQDYSPIMGFSGYAYEGRPDFTGIGSLTQSSQDFLEQAKNHLFDKDIHILIKEGSAAEQIIRSAKELSVDMIVMGSHSRKWLAQILMGSVTETVLNQTETPVLVIPTKKLDHSGS